MVHCKYQIGGAKEPVTQAGQMLCNYWNLSRRADTRMCFAGYSEVEEEYAYEERDGFMVILNGHGV